eukprot:scaffold335_cov253-Pinguiococcus_pyrenoidosus.AAC.1
MDRDGDRLFQSRWEDVIEWTGARNGSKLVTDQARRILDNVDVTTASLRPRVSREREASAHSIDS